MKGEERGWKGMKGDERGWKGKKGDERKWKGMKGDDRGWKGMKGDERWWKGKNHLLYFPVLSFLVYLIVKYLLLCPCCQVAFKLKFIYWFQGVFRWGDSSPNHVSPNITFHLNYISPNSCFAQTTLTKEFHV